MVMIVFQFFPTVWKKVFTISMNFIPCINPPTIPLMMIHIPGVLIHANESVLEESPVKILTVDLIEESGPLINGSRLLVMTSKSAIRMNGDHAFTASPVLTFSSPSGLDIRYSSGTGRFLVASASTTVTTMQMIEPMIFGSCGPTK